MYNVPGLSKQLQLSSLTACGLLTGGIKNWNDPNIAADNPGVSLPNVPVVPVTESDSAGTNYVLEEWCIDEQPALWAAFVTAQDTQSGGPTDGVALSATSPNSNWPGIKGGLDEQSTTAVASDVANNGGAIGAVQVKYAEDEAGFGGSDPTKNVALGEERQRRLHGVRHQSTWPRPWPMPRSCPMARTSSTSTASGPTSTTHRPTATS